MRKFNDVLAIFFVPSESTSALLLWVKRPWPVTVEAGDAFARKPLRFNEPAFAAAAVTTEVARHAAHYEEEYQNDMRDAKQE